MIEGCGPRVCFGKCEGVQVVFSFFVGFMTDEVCLEEECYSGDGKGHWRGGQVVIFNGGRSGGMAQKSMWLLDAASDWSFIFFWFVIGACISLLIGLGLGYGPLFYGLFFVVIDGIMA